MRFGPDGDITSVMGLDYSGYTGGLEAAAKSATSFSTKSTATLQAATEKQKKILASVNGMDSFSQGSLMAMKSFYQKQEAAAQRLRQVNRTGEEQQVRNLLALKLKAMKDEAQAARVTAEVNRRLFGDPAKPVPPAPVPWSKINRNGIIRVGGEPQDEDSKDWLSQLNDVSGKKSVAGKLIKLAMGAGPIMAMGMLAREANAFATTIEQGVLALDRGEKSAGAITAEFIKAIPVIGNLGDAIQKVFNINETVAVDRLNRVSKLTDAVTASTMDTIQMIKTAQRDAKNFSTETDRVIQLRNMEPGLAKDLATVDVNAARGKDANWENLQSSIDSGALHSKWKDYQEQKKKADDLQKVIGDYSGDEEGLRRFEDEYHTLLADLSNAKSNYDNAYAAELARTEAKNVDIVRSAEDEKKKIIADHAREVEAIRAAAADKQVQDAVDAAQKSMDEGRDFTNKTVADIRMSIDKLGKNSLEQQIMDVKADPRLFIDKDKLISRLTERAGAEGKQAVIDLQFNASIAGLDEIEQQVRRLKKDNPLLDDGAARDALRRRNLSSEAMRMKEQFASPQDRFAEQLGKLDAARSAGLIDDATHARGVAEAQRSLGGHQISTQSFVRSGSAEAAQYQYRQATMGTDYSLANQQLIETRASKKYLETIAKNTVRPQVADISGRG